MEDYLNMINKESPFNTYNGIKVDSYENGVVKSTITLEEKNLNFYKNGHGGFYYSLCDVLSGVAARYACEKHVVTVDARISFMRNVSEGSKIIGEAWVEKAGRTLAFTQCKITDEAGKLLCTCQSTFAVVK